MAIDDEPRIVTPPPELAEALADHDEAAEGFNALSYSHQREYAEWVDEAKQPETRRRRVARAIEMINEGKMQR